MCKIQGWIWPAEKPRFSPREGRDDIYFEKKVDSENTAFVHTYKYFKLINTVIHIEMG